MIGPSDAVTRISGHPCTRTFRVACVDSVRFAPSSERFSSLWPTMLIRLPFGARTKNRHTPRFGGEGCTIS